MSKQEREIESLPPRPWIVGAGPLDSTWSILDANGKRIATNIMCKSTAEVMARAGLDVTEGREPT